MTREFRRRPGRHLQARLRQGRHLLQAHCPARHQARRKRLLQKPNLFLCRLIARKVERMLRLGTVEEGGALDERLLKPLIAS